MDIKEARMVLMQFNRYRRDQIEEFLYNPKEIGEAIDIVCDEVKRVYSK